MQSSPLLEHLIENLRCLPGVGPKSAQRMAYHLLQRNRSGGMNLARALTEAMSKIGHCSQCRDFTEEETCNICNNPRRQNSGLLCVVDNIFACGKAQRIFKPLSKQASFLDVILS